jgi:Ca-activated chloride channel homolog
MRLGLLIFFLLHASIVFSQIERRLGEAGNSAFEKGEYTLADSLYRQSLSKNPALLEAKFNRADAMYRQGDFEGAASVFEEVASAAKDKSVQASALHNLGNTKMSLQDYEGAVDAYRKSLIKNPQDNDTRYNLAQAQRMLQQQQEQQQEKSDDGEKGDEDQDKKEDQEGDQNNEDQQDKGDQDKEGDQEKDDKNDGDKDKQDNGDPQESEGEPKEEPAQMSQEEAARLLESVKQDESDIQARLQKQRAKGKRVKSDKDW